ncbi:hypothetical protein [Prevotella falsenii]|uniref:hypothetical protein n=1 Tax=Prevotella falsenii TaxID=515414 RepID=UPI0012EBA143|nr:hypothetical protein [Prevotella falsenii]
MSEVCSSANTYAELMLFKNVFVPPNEQCQIYLSIAMARNALFEEREKNVFVPPNEQ